MLGSACFKFWSLAGACGYRRRLGCWRPSLELFVLGLGSLSSEMDPELDTIYFLPCDCKKRGSINAAKEQE